MERKWSDTHTRTLRRRPVLDLSCSENQFIHRLISLWFVLQFRWKLFIRPAASITRTFQLWSTCLIQESQHPVLGVINASLAHYFFGVCISLHLVSVSWTSQSLSHSRFRFIITLRRLNLLLQDIHSVFFTSCTLTPGVVSLGRLSVPFTMLSYSRTDRTYSSEDLKTATLTSSIFWVGRVGWTVCLVIESGCSIDKRSVLWFLDFGMRECCESESCVVRLLFVETTHMDLFSYISFTSPDKPCFFFFSLPATVVFTTSWRCRRLYKGCCFLYFSFSISSLLLCKSRRYLSKTSLVYSDQRAMLRMRGEVCLENLMKEEVDFSFDWPLNCYASKLQEDYDWNQESSIFLDPDSSSPK